jgi:tryptophan synthase alpha chain
MTSRITACLARNKKSQKKSLVGYITAGDPSLSESLQVALALAEAGVDILELGVPFSDPIADGPTNQKAAERALAAGTTLGDVLGLAKTIRECRPELPLLLFTYLNPVFNLGFEAFSKVCADCGVDGALIVDLPPEEAHDYRQAMAAQSLNTVFLASPTTDAHRLKLINQVSQGFVYYVGRTGVTGSQSALSATLAKEMATVRQIVEQPVMIGFGISTPEAARQAAQLGDGVVVGSAIVSLVEKSLETSERLDKVRSFVREIREALDS